MHDPESAESTATLADTASPPWREPSHDAAGKPIALATRSAVPRAGRPASAALGRG